ncbi:MAG: O-antigen ligase family protein [Candidatus Hodarchaeota archaeon]
MSLGLSDYIPLLIYLLGPIFIFLALFYKAQVGLFFLIPLLPLTTVLSKMIQFPLGKDFVDIMIISIALGWFFQERKHLLDDTPFNKLILLLLITTAVSVYRGNVFLHEEFSFGNTRLQVFKNFAILPLLYFLTVNNIKDKKSILLLVLLMTFSMLAMGVNFRSTFIFVKRYHFTAEMRLGGMLNYLGPNELASFFAQYTFVLLGIFFFDTSKMRRILLGLAMIFNSYVLIYTYSRAAYFSTLVTLAFICFLKDKRLLIGIGIFLVVWRAILPVSVVERIDMSFFSQTELTEDEARRHGTISIGGTKLDTVGRTKIWKQALDIFTGNPLFGTGYNTFIGRAGWDTHNQYLKILAEQGLIGITLFLVFIYLAFKTGWQLFKTANDRFLKGLGLGFTACVIASALANLAGDRWTYYNLMGFFWVFLALVVRGNIITENQLAADNHGTNDQVI